MVSTETNLPEAFDPATGENILWTAPLGTETNSTPVIAPGKVIVGTNHFQPRDPRHVGRRGVLLCLDEASGRLCWQLVVPRFQDKPYLDWITGGIASDATVEGNRVYVVTNLAEVMCLDLNGQADGNDGPFLDEGRHMAPVGEEPLEVTVDAQTGEPYWKERTRGEIFGSTLVADGKVYVGTRRGNLWVFEAGTEKRILATIDLGSGMMATPTAANGGSTSPP